MVKAVRVRVPPWAPIIRMSETFRRTKENFVCEHCGTAVTGNGYTNHCPQSFMEQTCRCPSRRQSRGCGGMMEPVSVFSKSGEYVITHRCTVCEYEKNNIAPQKIMLDALSRNSPQYIGYNIINIQLEIKNE